jgi:hypothetical protein
MMTLTDVDRFLLLLRDNPTLLPPVVGDCPPGDAMGHRSQDEVHSCAQCGKRAQAALIAETTLGPRWLDICMALYAWIQQGATR